MEFWSKCSINWMLAKPQPVTIFFSVHCVKHKNYSVYKVETANLKQISVLTLFIFNTPALNNVLL